MTNPSVLETTFFAALAKSSDVERRLYLDEACSGNPELRRQVEKMLEAHCEAGEFIEQPALTVSVDIRNRPSISEAAGSTIGPYKLLQQIGEGGMGVVFMAEQVAPIRRFVALKIIKQGMDTRQVIARFEAERQALAMMDHPNVAKVLDAGTTAGGRPYFVMELVKGVPITTYCDDRKLSLRARLELFVPVCMAVQHAHQKGLIHRDIKPTNVLVAEYDDHAVPKVIDFGVAKATAQAMTERTLFTEYGQVVGTVEYMSPEQAKLNQLDIDTRSDIYSLGVLMYELLTGTTPFGPKRLKEAAFDEMLRIIREEEPQKPSTRLSTVDTLPSIAANRGMESVKLNRQVRGELDWIAMKCLEKDRSRRYDSASDLAADIGCYLAGDAVSAVAPTRAYRLKKFAGRHRAGTAAGIIATSAIVIGIVAMASGLRASRRSEAQALAALADAREARALAERKEGEATSQRAAAERSSRIADAVNKFLSGMFRTADPARGGAKDVTVRFALDQARDRVGAQFAELPEVEASVRLTLGRTYLALGEVQEGVTQLERAARLATTAYGPESAWGMAYDASLASALLAAGRTVEAIDMYRSVFERSTRINGVESSATLMATNNYAIALLEQQRFDEAVPLLETTLATRRATLGEDAFETIQSMANLAIGLSGCGRAVESLPLYLSASDAAETKLGPGHLFTLQTKANYAATLTELGRFAESEPLLSRIYASSEEHLGPDHPQTLTAGIGLASVRRQLGHRDQAVALFNELLTRTLRVLGEDNKLTRMIRRELDEAATQPTTTSVSQPQ